MITVDNTKKYASTVLIDTVCDLFNGDDELIDAFFDDFVETYKGDRRLRKDFKDNEVVDEYLIGELEKRFTQGDIGRTLQKQMVRANDEAIADLAGVLDEKLRPVSVQLRGLFRGDVEYDDFRKCVTENLVVSNLDLNSATIKALKTMRISGDRAAGIMQLVTTVANKF